MKFDSRPLLVRRNPVNLLGEQTMERVLSCVEALPPPVVHLDKKRRLHPLAGHGLENRLFFPRTPGVPHATVPDTSPRITAAFSALRLSRHGRAPSADNSRVVVTDCWGPARTRESPSHLSAR